MQGQVKILTHGINILQQRIYSVLHASSDCLHVVCY